MALGYSMDQVFWIEVLFFWVDTPYSNVVGYPEDWRQHGPPKRWYPTTPPQHCMAS